jgi:ABC-type Fe3+ transport system permease subunit
VIGGAVYLMLVGVFALALGAIVRNTAGGISAFAAIFFIVPPLLNVLPSSWNDAVAPWLPDSAARAIFQLTHDAHSLAPGPGLALFCGYAALAVGVAAALLVRRDT